MMYNDNGVEDEKAKMVIWEGKKVDARVVGADTVVWHA